MLPTDIHPERRGNEHGQQRRQRHEHDEERGQGGARRAVDAALARVAHAGGADGRHVAGGKVGSLLRQTDLDFAHQVHPLVGRLIGLTSATPGVETLTATARRDDQNQAQDGEGGRCYAFLVYEETNM